MNDHQASCSARLRTVVACVLAAVLGSCAGPGDKMGPSRGAGVELMSGAVVYFGSAANCTAPATITFEAVRDTTPEWKTIVRDDLRPGTARYRLAMQRMHERIVRQVGPAATANGNDLVVRYGDIADERGLPVEDLTERVIDR